MICKKIPKHIQDSDVLTTLWDKADSIHVSELNKIMPQACMRSLFGTIGVSCEEQSNAICRILHIILEDYVSSIVHPIFFCSRNERANS